MASRRPLQALHGRYLQLPEINIRMLEHFECLPGALDGSRGVARAQRHWNVIVRVERAELNPRLRTFRGHIQDDGPGCLLLSDASSRRSAQHSNSAPLDHIHFELR